MSASKNASLPELPSLKVCRQLFLQIGLHTELRCWQLALSGRFAGKA